MSLPEKYHGVVRDRYRAGEEMEAIANSIGANLVDVSRFVYEEGLGKERYAGKKIPSSGSASIMQVEHVNPTYSSSRGRYHG
jgi:hypothetical protein